MMKPIKLSKNALLILRKLKLGGSYTKDDIRRLTSVTYLECNYAVRRLCESGVITRTANLLDMRKTKYHFLKPEQIQCSKTIPDPIKLQLANILQIELSA